MNEPIRIFIGTDATQDLGATIFEYSVKRHTKADVVFDRMESVTWPYPADPKNYPGTNFSFHRFAIPKLAGYRGKALYVDADMLVLKDIQALWDTPFDGATVLCAPSSNPKKRRQLSVMLLDCSRLDWDVDKIVTEDLDAGKFTYDALMYDLPIVPPGGLREGLSPNWNSLDKYVPGETCLVHYTELVRQPWLSRKNPYGLLWVETLRDAMNEGLVTREELQEATAKGWARPSLIPLLDTPRPLWGLFEKTVARVLDRGFVPHEDLRTRQLENKGFVAGGSDIKRKSSP